MAGLGRPALAGVARVFRAVGITATGSVVSGMITTCCDHMSGDENFVFCALNREFPFECQHLCRWFVSDKDSTPDRERVWTLRVVGPAQAKAEAAIAEPGSGESAC
jgi:hypothetical protein